MHISLAAEPLFHVGFFTVTNSLLASFLGSLLLIIVAFVIHNKLKNSPSFLLQNILEIVVDYMDNLAVSVGGEKARKFLPIVLTIFLYILVSNWLGLLPGFGSIGLTVLKDGEHEFVPLLRGATADLNTTLALALIAFFSIQFYGVSENKLSYFKKFFNLESPVFFFAGLLELMSEFSKIISFSFRLFGNVFAGEVLLAVVTALIPIIVPLPFLGLEIFVGLIQAYVFSILTLVFINLGTQVHGEGVEHGN